MTIGRRIEQNGIVLLATPQFTLDELDSVLDNPADRGLAESRCGRVAASPSDDVRRGINVHDFRAGGCRGQRTGGGRRARGGRPVISKWAFRFTAALLVVGIVALGSFLALVAIPDIAGQTALVPTPTPEPTPSPRSSARWRPT